MEKQKRPQIMYENLISTKKYAAMYNVTQKTVYDWIKTDRLETIEVMEKRWLDKTVKPKPSLVRGRNA